MLRQRRGNVLPVLRRNTHSNIYFLDPRLSYESPSGNSGRLDFVIRVRNIRIRQVSAANLARVENDLMVLFRNVLDYTEQRLLMKDNTWFQLTIVSSGREISDRGRLWRTMRAVRGSTTPTLTRLKPEDIIAIITNALTSLESLDLNDFVIRIAFSFILRISGYYNHISFYDFCKKKKAIVWVGEGGGCFWQSLAIASAFYEGDYKKLVGPLDKVQSRRSNQALDLYWEVKTKLGMSEIDVLLEFTRNQCQVSSALISDIAKVDNVFRYGLNVINFEGLRFLYCSKYPEKKQVYLLYGRQSENSTGHIVFVNPDKVGALWDKRRFCTICMNAYNDLAHRCLEVCSRCLSSECSSLRSANPMFELQCLSCLSFYFDERCRNRHKCRGNQVRCEECCMFYEVKDNVEHECYATICTNCGTPIDVRVPHDCFIQRLEGEKFREKKVGDVEDYVFFDIESAICPQTFEHIFAIGVVYSRDEYFVFNTLAEMCDYLFTLPKNSVVLAHNGGRYDFHFVKRECIRRSIRTDDLINGNTILCMELKKKKIKFVDSWRLISIPLKKFELTFGLSNCRKGFFPYRFYTPANAAYSGVFPDDQWFELDNMTQDDLREFAVYKDKFMHTPYNIKDEAIAYCKDDVRILKEGCLKFRDIFMGISDSSIDPLQYITIASVCMTFYRMFKMPENTIALVDERRDDGLTYSFDLYCELVNGMTPVQMEFGTVWSDGVSQTCILDCMDWGCANCFVPHTLHPTRKLKMYDLRTRFKELKNRYNNIDFVLKCEWGNRIVCQGISIPLRDEIEEPLYVRDAFYGGRTEVFRLYETTGKMQYWDVTSLYPSIQWGSVKPFDKRCADDDDICFEYPIGHPRRITEGFDYSLPYNGFIKCKVIPPCDLYIPVLPEKKNGKLIFDLTPKIGTWTIPEVKLAMKKGYIVEEIYEIVHYENTSNELFKSYIEVFLKLKQEAKGWVAMGCSSEEQKRQYIDEYETQQGIRLDYESITREGNPGLYFIAKNCLNNLWGKLGQRRKFSNVVDTYSEEEFQKIVHNDNNIVTSVVFHSSMVRTVCYTSKEEFATPSKNTNVAIAAFTTSFARIRLYEALDLLQQHVLYCDTDSVIYEEFDECYLRSGERLGDMANELDDDDYITEFVSTAPKSYAYVTHKGKQCVKVKGFTLGKKAANTLDRQAMKDIVLGERNSVVLQPMTFEISKDHRIHTKDWGNGGKRFKFSFDKRQIIYDEYGLPLDTRPFE